MKILIMGGGDSPEREVSLRSAAAVAKAANESGYKIAQADPQKGFEFLDDITEDTIVFPILHGAGGEDGTIQKELEKRHIPFLGSGSDSSEACFDKWATRKKLVSKGIPMPLATLVTKQTYIQDELSKRPHVLKILHGGSSIGTLIVRDPGELSIIQADKLFEMEEHAVLEELIEGTEITVSVLDDKALPVIEIVPPPDNEFDYNNKYNGLTQEICPPQTVSEDIQTKAKELAEQSHKIMGCRHLSRVDMMIDRLGYIYVLEINTMPGMTDQSLFPRSARVAGISMPKLVDRFVELVLDR